MNNYIKEPNGVDFTVESKEWTSEEVAEMQRIIAQSKTQKVNDLTRKTAKNTPKD